MTPDEFSRAGEDLYGKRWKPAMSRALGVDPATVWRYATGGSEIPSPVVAALNCFRRCRDLESRLEGPRANDRDPS